MKNTLKQLHHLLEVVRIDKDRNVVNMPKLSDCGSYHQGTACSPSLCELLVTGECRCNDFNKATEVVLVPNMLGFIHLPLLLSMKRVKRWYRIRDYATLLTQKPFLGNYVPTDEKGNVLEKPEQFYRWLNWKSGDDAAYYAKGELEQCEAYQAALDRVVFFGWTVYFFNNEKTVITNGENGNQSCIVFYSSGELEVHKDHEKFSEPKTNDELFTSVQHCVELSKLKA